MNAIRGVFSGRHLQVFTSGAEWMVTGDPLTPANIQLNRQTRVGLAGRPPGAAGRCRWRDDLRRAQRAAACTSSPIPMSSQAYQANDLADPRAAPRRRRRSSMAYDQRARLLHVVMADGSIGDADALSRRAGHRLDAAGDRRRLPRGGGIRGHRLGRGRARRRLRAGTLRRRARARCRADRQRRRRRRTTGAASSHLEGREVGVLADGAPRDAATVARRRGRDRPAGERGADRPRASATRSSRCRPTSSRPRRAATGPAAPGGGHLPAAGDRGAVGRPRPRRRAGAVPPAGHRRCSMPRRHPSPATSRCAASAGGATGCARSGASRTTRRCR